MIKVIEKCGKCKNDFNELDLFTYGVDVNGFNIEIKVCEKCLFDVIEKEFCPEDF